MQFTAKRDYAMSQFVSYQDKQERLDFLCRVVKKEIQHLQYSAGKVFKGGFTEERAGEIALARHPIS